MVVLFVPEKAPAVFLSAELSEVMAPAVISPPKRLVPLIVDLLSIRLPVVVSRVLTLVVAAPTLPTAGTVSAAAVLEDVFPVTPVQLMLELAVGPDVSVLSVLKM
ncbi:hypothetical protein J2Y66_002430 [Paenarthrobacter nitroguajacolicus]|nr:hypothetical protein [Paenarthrobacter nitroguajacolicus]